MSVIAFYPAFDVPEKRDSTGAFTPEARRFARLHAGTAVAVDNQRPVGARAKTVVATLEELASPVRAIAFFCHGTTRSTQLLGPIARIPAGAIAGALAEGSASEPPVVALYCCSTAGAPSGAPGADGEGGYADALRDALCAAGRPWVRVFAHDTVGHTTRNPRVRVFDGNGVAAGGTGGYVLVARSAGAWPAWRRRLHDPRDTLRLRFPLMSIGDVHSELISR